MPVPSSAMTDVDERMDFQRGFVGEEIQAAKRGVIFQRTEEMVSENNEACLDCQCVALKTGISWWQSSQTQRMIDREHAKAGLFK